MIQSIMRIRDRLFYGWVIVMASFIIGMIVFGTRHSFGVFFKSLESEFALTRMETSGVFSAYMVLCGVVTVIAGWAVDKYGPRIVASVMGLFAGLSLIMTGQTTSLWQLFIAYSLLLAMGTGGIYVVRMSTISRWFNKKRGLAFGMTTAGTGLGVVIMAPFATYLIDNLGWRMSYVVMGFIAWLLVISMAMLLRKEPGEMGLLPDGVKPNTVKTGTLDSTEDNAQPTGFSLLQALLTRSFWCLWFTWFLFSSCLHIVLTHIVPHATDTGISAMEAAAILSLIGGTSILGRLTMGRASDSMGRKTAAITCALLVAGAMIWLIWSEQLWMFYLFAVVFGFSYGGFDTVVGALVGDIFGLHRIGVILGMLVTGWSLGAATGPVIGGLIYDFSGNYSMAFSIGVIAVLTVTLLVVLTRREIQSEE